MSLSLSPSERLSRRLHGEPVDRPPNFDIMMQFAAHYIGKPLGAYYQDYRVLVDANLAVRDTFALDIVQAISDPYRETADWGAAIEFPDDSIPLGETPLLADPDRLAALRTPDPASGRRMCDRLEAVRRFHEKVGGQVPIMGWVEGALAEAADLRGVSNLLTDVYDRPEWVGDLLERCTEVAIAFARAQVEAGADIVGLGDAIASQVSPRMYEKYALPHEQRIFAAIHDAGGLARLHICGNSTKLLNMMARSGADIIDVDWMVDMRAAHEAFGPGIAVCGNFDPLAVMLRGTPDEVRASTAACMAVGGPNAISAAGCEIPDGTPHANLLAQAEALRELTS
jgi:MtaA/CmuA family methyltransferase